MRKGVSSQVFIYIFAVIVMAMILYFGFTQVVNVKSLTEKSVYVSFVNDLTNAVNDIYYKNRGSVVVFSDDSRNKPLELPKGTERVCFSNDEVELFPKEYNKFKVKYLNENKCINAVKGRLSFKLENMGEYVGIDVDT